MRAFACRYLCAAALAAACRPNPEVPTSAVVGCRANADCPEGFACSPELHRCLAAVRTDTERPSLSEQPAPTPPAGHAGTVFKLDFDVSEPLAVEPEVSFEVPAGGSRAFARRGNEGLSYSYEYAAAGDEGTGSAPVEMRLIDVAGNVAERLGAGTVRFDFAAPAVVQVPNPLDPGRAKDGTVVTIRFSASEPLGAAPRATAGTLEAALQDGSGPPWSGPFTFVLTATKALPEGDVPVDARLEDSAGNVAEAVQVAVLGVDFRAPALAQEPTARLRTVRPGETQSLTLRFDEVPAATPAVTMQRDDEAPVALEAAVVDPVTATFLHQVAAGEDGEWRLTLSGLRDAAGNEAVVRGVGAFRVDGRAPGLAQGPVLETPEGRDSLRAGDTVRVLFTTDERVRDPVRVVLALGGGHNAPLDQVSRAETAMPDGSTQIAHEFARTVGPVDDQGTGQISFEVLDEAGNRGGPWSLGPVTIDVTPPELLQGGVGVAPASPVPLGANLVLSVTAREVLSAAELQTDPSLPVGAAIVSGRTALWSGVVQEAWESGRYVLVATIRDAAGNATTLPPAEVTLDTRPPAVQPGASVEPARAKAGTLVRAQFDASEPVAAGGAIVRIGDVDMEPDASTDLHLVFTHEADASEHSGTKSVTARLTDAAGNRTTTYLGSVVYDFAPPSLGAESIAAEPASPVGIGKALKITVTADEALGSASVEVTPALDMGAALVSGRSAVWSHVVTDTDAGGVYAVHVRVQDLAGNEAETTRAAAFTLDTQAPTVLSDATVTGSPAKAGDTMTIAFEVSEPLPADPVVTIGSAAMTKDAASSGVAYVYTQVAAATETSGRKTVSAAIADSAGNRASSALGEVVYDFDPPLLTLPDVTAAPNPAGIGKVLVVQALASEALSQAELSVRAGGVAFGPATVAGRYATWTHAVVEGELADAAWLDLAVTVRDLAGNASDPLDVDHGAKVDPVAPSLAATPAPSVPSTPLRDGATLQVTFAANEELGPDPVVTVGSARLAKGAGPPVYDYSRVVDGTTEPEGTQPVIVVLEDAAGNRATASLGNATYDFTPPAVSSASVGYVPGADNPLAVVSKAKAGTRVVVAAMADERLDSEFPPTMTLECGTVTIAQDRLVATSASSATFEATMPDGVSDGTCVPAISWRDLAENSSDAATFADPPVLVKTSTPTLVVDQTKVTYLRSPWGNAAAENLGTFTIPAGPCFALAPSDPLEDRTTLPDGVFAMPDGVLTRVRAWADPARGSLLGAAAPDALGRWQQLRLASQDTPAAHVTGLDEAGNESAAVRIENAEWVATPNPSALGANPHGLAATAFASSARVDAALAAASGSELAGRDGSALVTRADPVWRAADPSGAGPGGRDISRCKSTRIRTGARPEGSGARSSFFCARSGHDGPAPLPPPCKYLCDD